MKERKSYAVLTFASTSQAMAFEKAAKKRGFTGRMIPLPGVISAGCGLAWRDDPTRKEALEEMGKTLGFHIQGSYTLIL